MSEPPSGSKRQSSPSSGAATFVKPKANQHVVGSYEAEKPIAFRMPGEYLYLETKLHEENTFKFRASAIETPDQGTEAVETILDDL